MLRSHADIFTGDDPTLPANSPRISGDKQRPGADDVRRLADSEWADHLGGPSDSLVPAVLVGQSRDVERNPMPRPTRGQWVLAGVSAACYALGYPLALIADNPLGWLLVTLGGVVLAALLVVTVRRIDRSR